MKMLYRVIRSLSVYSNALLLLLVLYACSVQRHIERSAKEDVLASPALRTAHVGISIFEPASGKYIFNYQGDKYFVPASNTKIATCYAAMKYLGDSLTGLRYVSLGGPGSKDIWIQATGDPTLLHPDFPRQPVIDFLKRDTSVSYMMASGDQWQDDALGSGWSWNDFADDYMAERSALPVYGNVIRLYGGSDGMHTIPGKIELAYGGTAGASPPFLSNSSKYSFTRSRDKNLFLWEPSAEVLNYQEIPFITSERKSIDLLRDTVRGLKLNSQSHITLTAPRTIHTQPTDSLLRLTMHRSDNFFAEQSLLMVSNERLGIMNDARIIDTLLKTDLSNLPQRPRWVDGSGLSRYNLFTPQDLVFLLDKIRSEFGMDRARAIFPTGDEGTLHNYYKAEKDLIFAKTGTLSGVVAISGYLYTKKNKLYIFSVLVNNHRASATEVRRAVEKFLEKLRSI